MASSLEFVRYVCEQAGGIDKIAYRKMFGEYGLYCDGKFCALICENQLFIKRTEAGRALLSKPLQAPPYAGASLYFLIEDLDDVCLISQLFQVTADALPPPRPKKKKAPLKA